MDTNISSSSYSTIFDTSSNLEKKENISNERVRAMKMNIPTRQYWEFHRKKFFRCVIFNFLSFSLWNAWNLYTYVRTIVKYSYKIVVWQLTYYERHAMSVNVTIHGLIMFWIWCCRLSDEKKEFERIGENDMKWKVPILPCVLSFSLFLSFFSVVLWYSCIDEMYREAKPFEAAIKCIRRRETGRKCSRRNVKARWQENWNTQQSFMDWL